MNEKRSLFSIDGITGFLIATLVLVTVVLSLAYISMSAQTNNANNFYDIKDADKIGSGIMGKNVSSRADHIIDVK